jgi:[ribosomal protein S18]-alanine N-acetyltransferase
MSTKLVELRSGSATDIAIIDSLMTAAFDPRFGEAWSRNQCLGMLALPGVSLLIASLDGTPAGFAMTRVIAGEAELLLLATSPDVRRRGVGSALLRAVIAACEDDGVETIHLEVRSGNDAVALYRAAGFAKVGERRDYYRGRTGQVFDALTFRRTHRRA